jgi:hypothetical protein
MLTGLSKTRLSEMEKPKMKCCINLPVMILMLVMLLAGSAAAQSTDPDKPTLMTNNEVKGRWAKGNAVSYYFGFEAGPGEVIVMFDFKTDEMLQNVAAELTDVYGRGQSNLDDKEGRSELSYFATTKGLRLVGRYQIKRRQKLVAKIAIEGEEIIAGAYKVRVEGGDASFGGNAAPTNQASLIESKNTESNRVSCLPQNGKLRLVMDDGTVQEINLSRVRETTVKPK